MVAHSSCRVQHLIDTPGVHRWTRDPVEGHQGLWDAPAQPEVFEGVAVMALLSAMTDTIGERH